MALNEELFVDMSQPSSYEELAAMHLDKRPVKGIVQPPVKPPEGKSHRNTNLLLFMPYVVSTICKHPDSWPFRKPVDTLHLKIPDYHTIVRHPMDFYTIRRRIQNFYYYDVNECIKDFRLVFYNCYLYNRPDTEIVSMAKTIEEIFVGTMAKCTEKEVEIPIPFKPSKSKGKGGKKKSAVSVKTETRDSETLTTSASFLVEGNFEPNQCAASDLSVLEPTSPTYNQTAFIPTSQANNTIIPTNQINNTSQLWTCPGCGYHSERLQDFLQKPSVSRTSIIRTRQQSAQSSKTQVLESSSSCSSDSCLSSSDFEKEIEELKERVKKLTEALEYLIKEFNDSKKRKLKRRNKRKLKNELPHAPVVKQKIVCGNESPLVAALPTHSVSTSTSLNNKLNKLQNQKQIQKSSSKRICTPKPAAETKKRALKRVCSPKPAAQTKRRKTNCNPPKKQPILDAPACPSPPPVSTATPDSGYRMKTEDADLKPVSFEEKSKLSEELLKLDGNATAAVATIIKLMEPPLYDAASTELEFDIDALKLSTLRELQKYVDNLKKETQSSGSIDKNDSSHKTQNASNEKEREKGVKRAFLLGVGFCPNKKLN
ncbi:Homeotic protein female sterile [Araneus ventricosus]|uniref:Homeotic protein female sterile n=1 Tax=Araneus ventricosus TaxID=182803 RepID=A0A4Y2ELW6_ARAVE|nr:Homeotic protein female sterile [Araneus ventricosus]